MVHHQVPGGVERGRVGLGAGAKPAHAALGAVVKDAKEQLRTLPDGVTYGVLRYLNDDVDLDSCRSADRVQLSGPPRRWQWPRRPVMYWQICWDGWSVSRAAAAIPMPLMHTVELNAGTVDTDAGPRLRAGWTWAPFGAEPSPSQPAQPVVVRRPDRHLHPRPRRRRRIDALGHRCRPQPAADRRASAAICR